MTDDLNARLCAALEAVMLEHGISQVKLAERLNRSRGYVQGRLNGKHELSIDLVIAVALLAHLAPEQLMLDLSARAAGRTDAGSPGNSPAGRPSLE